MCALSNLIHLTIQMSFVCESNYTEHTVVALHLQRQLNGNICNLNLKIIFILL